MPVIMHVSLLYSVGCGNHSACVRERESVDDKSRVRVPGSAGVSHGRINVEGANVLCRPKSQLFLISTQSKVHLISHIMREESDVCSVGNHRHLVY